MIFSYIRTANPRKDARMNTPETPTENRKWKHMLVLTVLRWLPAVMAFSYVMNAYCARLGVPWQIFTHYLGLVIAPMGFLYIASYVFKFCWYHRVFIHYITVVDFLNVTNWYWKIPITNDQYNNLHLGITAAFLVVSVATFFYRKWKGKKN